MRFPAGRRSGRRSRSQPSAPPIRGWIRGRPDPTTSGLLMEMEPLYRPEGVEERWQHTWEAERLFHADAASDKPSYAIAVPPPNVTGALHMGHALNGTLQDALVRRQRMRGFNVLWQPGYDHAGIATQAVVEKEL